jgi:hypothetical protein
MNANSHTRFVCLAISFAKATAIAGVYSISLASAPCRADLLWGANGHPFTAYPGVSLVQQLDYLVDLGMKSYRVNISDLNAAQKLRELVALGKSRNIDVLPVMTPSLDLANDGAPALYNKAYDFAFALVSMFKNDIRVWELGNEVENYAIIKACEMQDDGRQYNCNWGAAGGVGALEYFGPRWEKVSALLKGLSDATAAVDPAIRKAMGTAGWGHLGAFERMERDGIKWDISVWHMYGQDPEWAFEKLAKFNRPIWVTEFNNPDGSQSGEQDQANGLARWIGRLRELQHKYPVEAAHVYELLDETYWAPSSEASMGLVRLEKDDQRGWRAGEPKAAYNAMRRLIRSTEASTPLTGGTRLGKEAPLTVPSSTGPRTCELWSFDAQDRSYKNQAAYGYCLILGRSASDADLAAWVESRKTGTSADMLKAMLDSEEFGRKTAFAEMLNSNFVISIYRLLLGRSPDGQGLSDYTDQLHRGSLSRDQVIEEILESDEFRAKHPIFVELPSGHPTVRRACDLASFDSSDPSYENQVRYSLCLTVGHGVDSGGVWTAARRAGMSISQMLVAMTDSDEFRKRYATSDQPNKAYVLFVYNLLLGRDPDGQGYQEYTAQLNRGSLSRGDFTLAVIGSDEFRAKHPLLFRSAKETKSPENEERH